MKNVHKDKVVYQVYPKSFRDTTGNGIGDIKGIIEKLPYLHNLGIDYIWLNPMYKSPQRDNGYDISSYYQIDDLFGNMEDFDTLIAEANNLGIKLMMDIVANHTSTDHEWFQKALSGDKKYQEYYIFRKGKKGTPPTEAISIFLGSAWTWVDDIEMYYLHNFDYTQADLNWDNPEVREEIYKILNFWLEKGIGGFRFDVIDMVSKDIDANQMANGENLHIYIEEMNRKSFGNYDALTVGETWSADFDHVLKYSNSNEKEFSMVFTFQHIFKDPAKKWFERKVDPVNFINVISNWQEKVGENGWNSLFFNNHDLPRMATYFADKDFHEKSIKSFSTAMHMLKGTPYIYQGEELGMTNRHWKKEELNDVETINFINEAKNSGLDDAYIFDCIYHIGRDNARTPMQWDDSTNAGFSTGKPWLPVNENFKTINAKIQVDNENSIFNHYKKLIKLRKKYKSIQDGKFDRIANLPNDVFGFTRTLDSEEIKIICNFSANKYQLDIDLAKCEILYSSNDIISNNIDEYDFIVFKQI